MNELRELLHAHKWHLERKLIRGHQYLYAGRKLQGKKHLVYLCPETRLPERSAEEIMRKLRV